MAFISNFEYLLQGEDLRHVDSIKTKPTKYRKTPVT